MARPLRLQFADALYHVTGRGNPRQAIVKTMADRQAFLDGPAKHLRGQLYLGDDSFVAKHQPGRALKEIFRQHTQAIRPRLSALLPRKHTPKQGLAEAYRTHGYQMRKIADHLGLHYSTVHRWIRQAEKENT